MLLRVRRRWRGWCGKFPVFPSPCARVFIDVFGSTEPHFNHLPGTIIYHQPRNNTEKLFSKGHAIQWNMNGAMCTSLATGTLAQNVMPDYARDVCSVVPETICATMRWQSGYCMMNMNSGTRKWNFLGEKNESMPLTCAKFAVHTHAKIKNLAQTCKGLTFTSAFQSSNNENGKSFCWI